MGNLNTLKPTDRPWGGQPWLVRVLLSPFAIVPVLFLCAWVAAGFPSFDPLSVDFWRGRSFLQLVATNSGHTDKPWLPFAYAWQVMTYVAVFLGFVFFSVNTDVLKDWMGRKWLSGKKGLRSTYPGAGEFYDLTIRKHIDGFILRTSQYTSSVLPWLFVYFGLLLLYPSRYVPWTELLLVLVLTIFPFFILYKFDGGIARKISIWQEAGRDLTSSADAVIQQGPDGGDKDEIARKMSIWQEAGRDLASFADTAIQQGPDADEEKD